MRIKRPSSSLHEGDLTPMIDMTFQLIAFFMVLVNFTETEQDARVKLPESALAKPPEKSDQEFITVQMTEDADCIIEGRTVLLSGVHPALERIAEQKESQGVVVGDVTVIIRAHKNAATGKVQDLIKECQRARFEKFVLRAKEKAKF